MQFMPKLEEVREIASSGDYDVIPISCEMLSDFTTPIETMRVIAKTTDGEVMAVQHREYPIFGMQFHPESILTPDGKKMIENFIHIQ